MSAPPAAPPPDGHRRRDEATHERILQSAREQFAEKGYAGVRIDEVARAAGANKQLIYYYFKSKAGLYDAVLEQMIAERTGYWEQIAEADFATALGLMQRSRTDDPVWERLLSWEGSEFRLDGGRIRLEEIRRARYAVHADTFRRAQRAGEIDPRLDPEMLSVLVSSLGLARSTLPQVVALTTGLDPDGPEYVDRITGFLATLFEVLRPGDTAPDPDGGPSEPP